jgi:hypothetical protein
MQAPRRLPEWENFLSGQSVTGIKRERSEGYGEETTANQLPAK